MSKYLDDSGMEYLLQQIKDLINNDENYSEVLVSLLERILAEDKIQRISKLSGTEVIPSSSTEILKVPCGFDAYEIKTIKAQNLTNDAKFQIEILEDDVSQEIIYQSRLASKIYSNAGDVCNIDEQDNKSVYVRIINPTDIPIKVSYEIKLINLLVS